MEVIFNKQNHKVVRYALEDVIKHQDKIKKDFTSVFASYETDSFNEEDAINQVDETLSGLFYGDYEGFVYVLYNGDNLPISLACYTALNGHLHLEIVATNKEWCTFGYAKFLSLKSFEDLANNFDVDTVTAIVNNKNYASGYLQDSLMKDDRVSCYLEHEGNRTGYTYDISKFVKSEEFTPLP